MRGIVHPMILVHKKNDPAASRPFFISLVRVLHIFLIMYAAGAIGIGYAADGAMPPFDRPVAVGTALPLFFASLCCWFALTVRGLFSVAIFLCVFVSLALATLPLLARVFFPAHLFFFSLAAIYGFSAAFLAHYYCAQPVPKRR